MAFDFAGMVQSDFETFMLSDLGESVTYSAYGASYTYSTASSTEVDGYLIGTGTPVDTVLNIIIATFTQNDIQMFDLGNIGVDDHKAYIPKAITPVEKDRITRGDGEVYEVVAVLHEHSIAGTKNFYTVHIRRRRT